MIAASTRKAPNAFHFRRQIQILQKAGGGGVEQQFQARLHCTWKRFSY